MVRNSVMRELIKAIIFSYAVLFACSYQKKRTFTLFVCAERFVNRKIYFVFCFIIRSVDSAVLVPKAFDPERRVTI